MGDAGSAALAAERWPALEVLWLDSNNLEEAGAAALAAARWPALKELELSRNNLGGAGAAALAAARWPALLKLRLGENNLGYAGVASLAAARWPALKELCLDHNILGLWPPAAAAVEEGYEGESLSLGNIEVGCRRCPCVVQHVDTTKKGCVLGLGDGLDSSTVQKCVHGESNPGQAHGKRLYSHYTMNAPPLEPFPGLEPWTSRDFIFVHIRFASDHSP